MAQLPLVLSQTQHRPKFPKINTLVHPHGQNMSFGVSAPVLDWPVLFKPQVWGYFVGPDFGLSWHWCFRIALLAVSAFYFFRIFLGARSEIAALGSLALCNSSFFAFWSFISEPLTGLALASACLSWRLATEAKLSRARRLVLGALLVWTLASFCLSNLYPPFQIPLIYFVGVFYVANFCSKPHRISGLLAPFFATLVALGIVALHFWQNQETLQLILGTDYPGQRLSTGGDLSPGRFFLMTLLSLSGYTQFMNINQSEAGSTFFVGLSAIFMICFDSMRSPKKVSSSEWALLGLVFLFALYCFVGLPTIVAKFSGLWVVPGPRTLGVWTLINVSLFVYLAQKWNSKKPSLQALAVGAGGILALLLVGYFSAETVFPQVKISKLLVSFGLASVLLWTLSRRPTFGMLLFLCVLMLDAAWFNPVDRHTHARIMTSSTVKTFLNRTEEDKGKPIVFLDSNTRLANFPRLVGVPSLGGMHYPPQIRFWETIGTDPALRPLYNRFAHVSFSLAEGKEIQMNNPAGDVLQVSLPEEILSGLKAVVGQPLPPEHKN